MKSAAISRAAKSLRKDAFVQTDTEHPVWRTPTHIRYAHRDAEHVHLTRREREVLSLLCEGLPNKLIARRLKIASGTVKVHISNIFRALNVSNRLQAVLLARSWELRHRAEEPVRHMQRARHR